MTYQTVELPRKEVTVMKKFLTSVFVLFILSVALAAEDWITVTVKAYETFPGGLLILKTEPVESLTQQTQCTVRVSLMCRGKEVAVNDSTGTFYPNERELHVNGGKLLEQCRRVAPDEWSFETLYRSVIRWEIQPKR